MHRVYLMVIAKALKTLREAKGLSREELSEHTGIPVQYINGVEECTYELNLSEVNNICSHLNIMPEALGYNTIGHKEE